MKIKYLAREGLLPETYRKKINKSLICKWKQEPKEKYVGYELNTNLEELYEAMKMVSEDSRLTQFVKLAYRINKTLKNTVGTGIHYFRALRDNKKEVVTTILQTRKLLGINRACKLMGISKSTFRVWAMEEYFKWGNSISTLKN